MAELQVFEDRFNLPIAPFITQILRERFPDLDFRKGSALYRAVVVPASVIFQPFRDRLSILRRNQSLRFYQYMRPSELDKLVANFFITRQPASTASGTARVYFAQPDNRTIPANAVFATAEGLQFRPVTALAVTSAEMTLNQEDGLFFVDVPVVALAPGEDYEIEAESLSTVSNVPNAIRVTNRAAFTGGRDEESNVALVNRTKDSLATRTITSRNAIIATLNENFPGVIISQEVIGYGDPEMTRDTIKAFASYDELFGTSYCRKFNVAYDPETRQIYTGSGAPPSGYVQRGAVLDVSNSYGEPTPSGGEPYFWYELEVERNGETIVLTIQRGDTIKLVTGDADEGQYIIDDIIYSEPFSTVTPPPSPDRNEATHLLILDEALTAPQGPGAFDPSPGNDNLTAFSYTIQTGVRTSEFHIGGKADVYVHTTGVLEDEILISQLYVDPNALASNFFDIPVSSVPVDVPVGPPGVDLYEDGKVFLLPVINIVRIEQVDPSNSDLIIKTLEPETEYKLIYNDVDTRFTPNEDSFIRFIDSDPAGANFANARMRVVYQTNTDIETLQEFVNQSVIKDTTKDVLVRAAQQVQLDIELSFRGDATQTAATQVLENYIEGIPQGGEANVNDIVAVMNLFGVNDIEMPVTLRKTVFNADGSISTEESTDRLEVDDLQRFIPVDELSVTKL